MNFLNSNKFSSILSIIAILISVFAVYFPYKQQEEVIEREYMENLNIQINRYSPQSPIVISDIKYKNTQVVYIFHKVQISNTGNRKISIVSSNIEIITSDSNIASFRGLYDGYFFLDNKQVDYPIMLDAGETKVYWLKIGYILPRERVEKISENLQDDLITKDKADLILKDSNIDILGNSIEYYSETDSSLYVITKNVELSDNKAILYVESGNGKTYSGTLEEYKLPALNIKN